MDIPALVDRLNRTPRRAGVVSGFGLALLAALPAHADDASWSATAASANAPVAGTVLQVIDEFDRPLGALLLGVASSPLGVWLADDGARLGLAGVLCLEAECSEVAFADADSTFTDDGGSLTATVEGVGALAVEWENGQPDPFTVGMLWCQMGSALDGWTLGVEMTAANLPAFGADAYTLASAEGTLAGWRLEAPATSWGVCGVSLRGDPGTLTLNLDRP